MKHTQKTRHLAADDPRHGTTAGYNAHYKTDRNPCHECREAKYLYEKRRRMDQQLRGITRTVASIGLRRRVQALQRLGWPLSTIAAGAGWKNPQALQYVMKSPTVFRDSRDRICAVYDELSMKIPPHTSGNVRARKRAIANGFAPPLAWDNIDDPNERPKIGVTKRRDTVAEYRWLREGGISHDSALKQLNISEVAMGRALLRVKKAA